MYHLWAQKQQLSAVYRGGGYPDYMARTGCGWSATANAASSSSVGPARPGRLRPFIPQRVSEYAYTRMCNITPSGFSSLLLLPPFPYPSGVDSSSSRRSSGGGGGGAGGGGRQGKLLAMTIWLLLIDFVRVQARPTPVTVTGTRERAGGNSWISSSSSSSSSSNTTTSTTTTTIPLTTTTNSISSEDRTNDRGALSQRSRLDGSRNGGTTGVPN
ncbi:hypothetical protein M0802_009950 [Mischocyttarus mexicanus]|nr:hypothetical protein M0802_009950 [Mischocyttarus mexicanus]